MAEYIEKEQILEALVASDDPWVSYLQPGIVKARAVVNSLPAADVAPMVHGRWEYDENATDWGIGGYICSECKTRNNNLPCNRVKSVRMFSGAKFCPNCGAKMDLED